VRQVFKFKQVLGEPHSCGYAVGEKEEEIGRKTGRGVGEGMAVALADPGGET
jgi:hypothetical protein